MVRKPYGSIRVCVDYRELEECTVKDSFTLPRIDDLLDKLRNTECMTHLDLRPTYNQVRMSDDGPQDDSIAATTFQGLTSNRTVTPHRGNDVLSPPFCKGYISFHFKASL